MIARRFAWLAPFAALATAGCFATRNDVRVLQADIARLQQSQTTADADAKAVAERARLASSIRDSVVAERIREIGALSRATSDSLMAFFEKYGQFVALTREEHRTMMNTQYNLLELAGLSQKKIADLQESAAAGQRAVAASVPVPGDTSTTGAPNAPEMYRSGLRLLQRGAYSSASTTFEDLIARYPTDTVNVPKAIFQLAEAYSKQGNNTAKADSLYASVVERFPKSEFAPTALYKRAQALEKAQPKKAKSLYDQLIRDYPHSDVTDAAKVRSRALPPE